MRSKSVVLAALCTTLVLAGCESGSEETQPAAEESGEGWTVLVYSIADTDLEPFLLSDLTELSEVGSQSGLALEAFVDRAADYSSEEFLNLGDWVGAKEMSIEEGSAIELSDLGDVDTGDPAVLSDFITRGFSENPAENYALVLSDHGASWPGVGGDESTGHSMLTLEEISSAVSTGLAGAGIEKLDLLGFDACLMATYETASIMAPLADRMIASQELEPGHGWDYNAFGVLADDPATDVDTLGTAILDGFLAQGQSEGTEAEITLSMIDLTQMPAVDQAVAEFAGALSERAATVAPVIGRERETVLGFGRNPDPEFDTQMADLGMLASQIGVEALDVSDQADQVIRSINDAVVYKVAGSTMGEASGLSVYFPPEAELMNTDYASVSSAGAWGSFLSSYYGAGDAIPAEQLPQFVDDGTGAQYEFGPDGLSLLGTFEQAAADNVASAEVTYGVAQPDGSVLFYGQEPADVAADGSGEVSALYDLTTMVFTDGTDSMTGFLSLSFDQEAAVGTADIPVAYVAPDAVEGEYADVTLSIVFDSETGDIVNETYYALDADAGTYGELTTDPEGLIYPKLLQMLPDGTLDWVASPGVGLYADLPSLGYDFAPMESGTALYVELGITDFGGNSDSLAADVVVP